MPEHFSSRGLETKRLKSETIEHVHAILKDLGLTIDDLREKNVLDVGAGDAELARYAKELGINTVTSLDLKPPEKNINDAINYVIGDARKLPFPDETFDLVISHAALHFALNSVEDIKEAVQEAIRVLKPGGELRFGPGALPADILEDLQHIEDFDSLPVEERIRIIREKSLEILQSTDPRIREQSIECAEANYLSYYYHMKKPR